MEFALELFPTNGLDHSILAPVLLGLATITFFNETLGWPAVGIVVPGYLASVLIAAPISGAVIAAEALVTYALARALGDWVPRTGLWVVAFGRERFFLLIAASVLVRLVAEGVALPWLASHYEFRHASELYSVGLVLVPLVANAFWNVGLGRGLFYVGTTTALTFAITNGLLIPLTNLSLSRFELTYESVALDFLSAPKAYLLLLIGTVLAARGSIRWGWDYNGILVPGLLAVAWYYPAELVSTLAEATWVAWVARGLVRLPPLRGQSLDGPRRLLLIFSIGFATKMTVGFVAMKFWPGLEILDFYGFGYVLPALVADKIFQKSSVPRVLVPTLAVSFVGFVVANIAGYGLTLVASAAEPPEHAEHGTGVETRGNAAWELTRQAAWPLRPEQEDWDPHFRLAARVARDVARGRRRVDPDEHRRLGMRWVRVARNRDRNWWILRRLPVSSVAHLPALAVADEPSARGIVIASGRGGPVASLALAVSARANARAVVVGRDRAQARAAAAALTAVTGWSPSVEVRERSRGVSFTRLPRLSKRYRVRLEDAFGSRFDAEGRLFLSPETVDAVATSLLGAGDPDSELAALEMILDRSTEALLPVTEARSPPEDEELRLFSSVIAPVLLRWRSEQNPSAFVRGVAAKLGLAFSRSDGPMGPALVLHPTGGATGLVWVARGGGAGPVVASHTVNEEEGMGRAAAYLGWAASSPHILLDQPVRRPVDTTLLSSRSFVQRAEELLLAEGASIVTVRAAPRRYERLGPEVILSTGTVSPKGAGIGPPLVSLTEVLAELGLESRWYDGSRELLAFRGSDEVLLRYSRRFARGRVGLAYWSAGARARLEEGADEALLEHLASLGEDPQTGDLVAYLRPRRAERSSCNVKRLVRRTAIYRRTENPGALRRALDLSRDCSADLVRDQVTGRLYLVLTGSAGAEALRLDPTSVDVWYEASDLEEVRRARVLGATRITWSGSR